MRIAIIDDDTNAAETTEVLVEGAGHQPITLPGPLKSVQKALDKILQVSDAAICDHRLQRGNLAKFYGAQLAAACILQKRPALLISQFIHTDIDVSIRLYRAHLPVVLAREDISAERIEEGIQICNEELSGKPMPQRQTYRQMVRVEETSKESGEKVADVIIPAWKPTEAVRLPIDLFPRNLRKRVKPGAYFFARINLGAENSDELFFCDFEPAAAPSAQDQD